MNKLLQFTCTSLKDSQALGFDSNLFQRTHETNFNMFFHIILLTVFPIFLPVSTSNLIWQLF